MLGTLVFPWYPLNRKAVINMQDTQYHQHWTDNQVHCRIGREIKLEIIYSG